MSDTRSYRIERVADFLNIPPERLGVCLTELAASIEKVREKASETKREFVAFTWTDDGKDGVSYRLIGKP